MHKLNNKFRDLFEVVAYAVRAPTRQVRNTRVRASQPRITRVVQHRGTRLAATSTIVAFLRTASLEKGIIRCGLRGVLATFYLQQERNQVVARHRRWISEPPPFWGAMGKL